MLACDLCLDNQVVQCVAACVYAEEVPPHIWQHPVRHESHVGCSSTNTDFEQSFFVYHPAHSMW